MIFPPEPTIRIGDRTLNTPEAMTVRVAHEGVVPEDVTTPEAAERCATVLRSFRDRIRSEGLGEDETGRAIAAGYVYHAGNVLRLLEDLFETP